ncbi:MAG: hypothetical protein HY869_09485 [Chloroflexi bacterium]|nr:hypothetical protein [Chloroflexota bacterium]
MNPAFKLLLKALRILAEFFILVLILMSLWLLGVSIGNLGARRYIQIYITAPGSLWQILFAVIELSAGIWFFIAMFRQQLPGGIRELGSGEPTLAAKAKYFPGIFALGVFAGLIGNAVTILIQEAALYLK